MFPAFILCLAFILPLATAQAPAKPEDISVTQLRTLLALPLEQAIARRNGYKGPLNAAYRRQIALLHEDCLPEATAGQQPYNICMGKAEEQADTDYIAFYNNLQWLCHDAAQLATLQASEAAWQLYHDAAMRAVRAAWPDGTGAPGAVGETAVRLVRDRMQELHGIYSLNISQ